LLLPRPGIRSCDNSGELLAVLRRTNLPRSVGMRLLLLCCRTGAVPPTTGRRSPTSATVKDVMTTSVVAVKRNADFKQIVSVLRRFRVSACPVINDAGHVIGVVSEADLLYKEAANGRMPAGLIRLRWRLGEKSKANAVTAGRLMTSPAVTIDPDASVAVAAKVMQDRWIKRLPVVSEEGLLIGIVTRSDVLSVYERPDHDILAEILTDVIGAEFGLNASAFDVSVTSGVVTISGLMQQPRAAAELPARLQRVDGVVAVRNCLSIGRPGKVPHTSAGRPRVENNRDNNGQADLAARTA
jgi:CBS domain-containing protein